MTQRKNYSPNRPESNPNFCLGELLPDTITDRCIRVSGWALLIIALCVFVAICCVAVSGKHFKNNSKDIFGFERSLNYNKSFTKFQVQINHGCQEISCSIACKNSSNLFGELFETLKNSICKSTDILVVENQNFPESTLANGWVFTNKKVREVAIANSNLSIIRNEAFNSPEFTDTFKLTLHNLKLDKVYAGALLGLSSLKYLIISSVIVRLNRSFFQPVQMTLTNLKLSADLSLYDNGDLFGISYMPKLEYCDLSGNKFYGPLRKEAFWSIPNVKYLYIMDSQISSIEDDVFVGLKELRVLNLSNNLLTTISSLEQLLVTGKTFIYLSGNNWLCNCEILTLVKTYRVYRSQFMDNPYCKLPHRLYGHLLNEIKFSLDECGNQTTTGLVVPVSKDTPCNDNKASFLQDKSTSTDSSLPVVAARLFEMRCVSTFNVAVDGNSFGLGSFIEKRSTFSSNSSNNIEMESLYFDPPSHDFALMLFNNRSVEVVIETAGIITPLYIIWFSEKDYPYKYIETPTYYNCLRYTNTSILVDPLIGNTTYTFCLIPDGVTVITPFNCLPLHVPKNQVPYDDNVWISTDEKQFTVGIICLIFSCSTLMGGVVAYFGFKAYPDLLKGSKKVLVVKKCDPTSYVSTISEYEYLKSKKDSPETKLVPHFSLSVKQLEQFLIATENHEHYYEQPCIYGKGHKCQVYSVSNKYAMSPKSPPPLPKRNCSF